MPSLREGREGRESQRMKARDIRLLSRRFRAPIGHHRCEASGCGSSRPL